MRKATESGTWSRAREGRGFRHAGGLIAARVQKAGEKHGFAQTRLLTEWDSVVGSDIAAKAEPLKVSYARGGFGATLVVRCNGALAPEVELLAPVIRERVNACYGYNAISRVRITQTGARGFAEEQAPYEAAPPLPKLDGAETADLAHRVEGVTDPDLRAALLDLGTNITTVSKTRGASS